MRSIILAAGIGSRLRPITNLKPKTLVEVNGKPMLGYLIDNLIINGLNDIVICIWYKGEQIKNYCINNYPNINFSFVENKEYLETNNMYSLYLAKEFINGDIILMNSDLVYESNIIKGLINTKGTNVAVDKGTYDNESMKVTVKNNIITDISKVIKKESSFGRSIDVYKIINSDVKILKENLIKIIEEEKDKNQWTEVLLQKLFNLGLINAKPFEIGKNKWVEIDNYEDLYFGEILFNKKIKDLKNRKVFLLDKDGTLTLGKNIIEGTVNFINKLKENNKKYYVLSNNSSKNIKDNLATFNNLGLEGFNEKNFIISTDIALDYFKEKNIKKIYVLGSKKIIKDIEYKGFKITSKKPQALLLTYDTEITYEKIKLFHSLIKQGIPYYSTHIDNVCPTEDGDIPDIGSFIKMFEVSTGKKPEITFGKPSKYIINYIKNNLGFKENEVIVIGDRVYTDIMLKKYGNNIFTILTLTGEAKREDVEFSDIKPDLIIKDLNELIKYI